MSAGTVQVGLAPLVRAEALHLLGGIRMGLVVCADRGLTVHRSGFHTLVGAELVVRTPMGTEVDPAQEAGLPVTYRAESLDERSLKGWYVTYTGTAVQVTDPHERNHYQRALPAFTNGANRILRIRPRLVSGQRFQRLTAPPDTL